MLDTNYIEEIAKLNKYSIFPTVINSEKPDSVSAAILEGRVAIVVDGSLCNNRAHIYARVFTGK